jgi:hypothetical protein
MFDVFTLGADEQSLHWAFMPECRSRGIIVERGMLESLG